MSYKIEFIEHTADIAVKLSANSIEELFMVAADSLKQTVFESSKIEENEEKNISITENSLEELLVNFLSELNYLFQVKRWVFSSLKKVSIENLPVRHAELKQKWSLEVTILGEKFDEEKHHPKLEIKAVTFHQMEIKKIDDVYSTILVFDI